jgi:hypothetical protein
MQYKTLKLLTILTSTALLPACDPSFQSTSDQCAQNEDISVIIPAPSLAVKNGADEYELYLQDIFVALEPQTADSLSTDEQAALASVKTIINDFLDYEENAGTVNASNNILDFLESLIATTDPEKEVELFAIAKRQIATGINADNDFCSYSTRNIVINDGSDKANPIAFAEWSISYSPFTQIVQQSVLISEIQDDLDSSEARQNLPFVGFYQAEADQFKAVGYTQPILRQAIMNGADLTSNFVIDDGRDNKLGQIAYEQIDSFCDPDQSSFDPGISNTFDPSDFAVCGNGENVRPVAKSQCDGSEAGEKNETNRIRSNTFDLGENLTGFKRLRVELDYENNETRFYTSDYNEATFDSDGTTVIKDPTGCEKQAILDELAEQTPDTAVSLTIIEDPGFDVITTTDADGDEVIQEPAPLFTYDGLVVPARQ